MKSSLAISIFAIALTAIIASGCVTKGPSPSATAALAAPQAAAKPAVPVKVAKERTVITKVPVLVKEASFYSDGLADQYTLYKLDEAKKGVLEAQSYDAARPDPVQRVVSEYKDGRLSAEITYESDGKLRGRRELSYDASNRLILERSLDGKGKPQSSSAYDYDAKGRKVEWRAMDANGTVKATSSYVYGLDGLASVAMKDSGGRAAGTIKLEYAGGKLAKRSYFGADGALDKYETYAYDGGLLASMELRRADGSFVSKTAYAYGPMGEMVKSTELGSSGSPGNYVQYEYVVREDSAIETYYE
jgi:hypothetical protein